jgi:hypothetical protein
MTDPSLPVVVRKCVHPPQDARITLQLVTEKRKLYTVSYPGGGCAQPTFLYQSSNGSALIRYLKNGDTHLNDV